MQISCDPTENFLLILAGRSSEKSEISEAQLKLVEWDKLSRSIEHHRIEGIAFRNLKNVEDYKIPDEFKDDLQEKAKRKTIRSMRQTASIAAIAQVLDTHKIEYLLLKGEAISHRSYKFAFDRQSRDMDLLVSESNFDRVLEIVNTMGYQQVSPSYKITEKLREPFFCFFKDITFARFEDKQALELHVRLFANSRLLPLEFEECFEKRKEVEIGSKNINALDSVTLLLYLSVHAALHKWNRLKWLVDIDLLVSSMELDEIRKTMALARANGLTTNLILTGELLSICFGNHRLSNLTPQEHSKKNVETIKHYVQNLLSDGETRNAGPKWRGYFREVSLWMGLKPDIKFKLEELFRIAIHQDLIHEIQLSSRWMPLYFLAGILRKIWTYESGSLQKKE